VTTRQRCCVARSDEGWAAMNQWQQTKEGGHA
jgi:hypothetical protein